MTIGELVGQLLERIYAFWPVRVVHDWEQGVHCVLGQARRRLTSNNGARGTGLHFFCPGLSEIKVEETTIEVAETDVQTVTTLDDRAVTFSMGVKYRIYDLQRMYTSIHDARETIYTELSSVAGWCATQLDYAVLASDLCEHVAHETKEAMGEWGIEILSLSLINVTEAQAVRLISNRQGSLEPQLAAS